MNRSDAGFRHGPVELVPGTYQLHVGSSRSDGEWEDVIAPREVTVDAKRQLHIDLDDLR